MPTTLAKKTKKAKIEKPKEKIESEFIRMDTSDLGNPVSFMDVFPVLLERGLAKTVGKKVGQSQESIEVDILKKLVPVVNYSETYAPEISTTILPNRTVLLNFNGYITTLKIIDQVFYLVRNMLSGKVLGKEGSYKRTIEHYFSSDARILVMNLEIIPHKDDKEFLYKYEETLSGNLISVDPVGRSESIYISKNYVSSFEQAYNEEIQESRFVESWKAKHLDIFNERIVDLEKDIAKQRKDLLFNQRNLGRYKMLHKGFSLEVDKILIPALKGIREIGMVDSVLLLRDGIYVTTKDVWVELYEEDPESVESFYLGVYKIHIGLDGKCTLQNLKQVKLGKELKSYRNLDLIHPHQSSTNLCLGTYEDTLGFAYMENSYDTVVMILISYLTKVDVDDSTAVLHLRNNFLPVKLADSRYTESQELLVNESFAFSPFE